jgi:hypothetical protein
MPRPLTVTLKPVAAIGDPPCGEKDRDGGGAGPPERKQEIGHQPEQHEDHPEYLFLHGDDCSSGAALEALKTPSPVINECARDISNSFVTQVTGRGARFPSSSV